MTKTHQETVFPNALLSYKEAADLLGIHPGTLRKWVSEGRIGYVKVGPRRVKFRPHQLTDVMSEHSGQWGGV